MSYGTPPPPPPGQPPYGGPPAGQNPYGQQPYGQQPSGAAGDPGTLDLPWYGIGFPDAVKRAFQKYARFDGRASRSEYWWYVLATGLIGFILYIPVIIGLSSVKTYSDGTTSGMPALSIIFILLLAVFELAVLVPTIAVGVRRLHDGGFSGWLYLLAIVPCVSIVLLVLMVLPSKPEGARFDRNAGGMGGGQYGGGYGSSYGQ